MVNKLVHEHGYYFFSITQRDCAINHFFVKLAVNSSPLLRKHWQFEDGNFVYPAQQQTSIDAVSIPSNRLECFKTIRILPSQSSNSVIWFPNVLQCVVQFLKQIYSLAKKKGCFKILSCFLASLNCLMEVNKKVVCLRLAD